MYDNTDQLIREISMNFRFLNIVFFHLILIFHFSINGSSSSDQTSSETPLKTNDQFSYEKTSKSKSLHGLFTMRLKGGFNLATWWGASSKIDKETNAIIPPYKHRTLLPGFTAGAALGLRLHKYFSIQPEILFTMKGYKTKIDTKNNQNEIIKEIIRLRYLEFSILPKLTLPFSAGFTHIYSGPVIGIKIGFSSYNNRSLNKQKYTESIPESVVKKMDKGFEDSDIGLAMGICWDIGKGTDLFIFDIRYTLGLKEITKLSDILISEGFAEQNIFKHKSNSISLNIGYALIF